MKPTHFALDTDGEGHGCVWMDAQYNWSDHEIRDECGESLNLAINSVADVLHTLCNEAHQERRGDLNGDGQVTGRCAGYRTPNGGERGAQR